ncbi:uncharacterized protein L969DRAFT_94467 [Mixia osmundae IAM 14324]|uniref:TMEM205-like domain-containing protein n=1 Tax=Mixia osmundae (strain CBS 9802 / IAM 14324 / JCM 22182 / KY 12970) TaxID=764103 RepID=G7E3K3_MIXOS|nr:uncharacterized protein L969DRAFT_94467 [Mixia osmundae IAM 14324]KEI39399.1 hypothetical protein L969DRAFT_94467 [Mixia osmundae IAM 14324]GAA97413.1 hypothetical protein E5Q_04091 [Mixia osmundae IAM 14324]
MSSYNSVSLRNSLGVFTSAAGIHQLANSYLFGVTVWHTFFNGPIAYKTLPRMQFGNLQSKLFPVYFASASAAAAIALATFIKIHPEIRSSVWSFSRGPTFQAWTIGAGVLLPSLLNWAAIGPWVTGIMFERHRLEKREGKAYTDPEPSEEMKTLNSRFITAHSVSSIVNLVVVIALAWHTAWTGANGRSTASLARGSTHAATVDAQGVPAPHSFEVVRWASAHPPVTGTFRDRSLGGTSSMNSRDSLRKPSILMFAHR